MALVRFLLLGITILLHSVANAQTPPVISDAPTPMPDSPVVTHPPDEQPRREFRLLMPDGFGGLKEEAPMTGGEPSDQTGAVTPVPSPAPSDLDMGIPR
jgi:hypothetical protein